MAPGGHFLRQPVTFCVHRAVSCVNRAPFEVNWALSASSGRLSRRAFRLSVRFLSDLGRKHAESRKLDRKRLPLRCRRLHKRRRPFAWARRRPGRVSVVDRALSASIWRFLCALCDSRRDFCWIWAENTPRRGSWTERGSLCHRRPGGWLPQVHALPDRSHGPYAGYSHSTSSSARSVTRSQVGQYQRALRAGSRRSGGVGPRPRPPWPVPPIGTGASGRRRARVPAR